MSNRIGSEMTVVEAADELGISRLALTRLIRSGELASHQDGPHLRLWASDVYSFKQDCSQRQN